MVKFAVSTLIMGALTAGAMASEAPDGSPVALHGQLAVEGNRIVGAHGEPVSLAGISMFWSTTGWGQERFYNKDAISYLAEEWDISLIRAAISVGPPGDYISDPDANMQRARTVIDAAIDNGIYVIVDWHAHKAEDAPAPARAFFEELATEYGDVPNVIWEIYNEPLQVSWSDTVKPYAEFVIEGIRAVDPDNLIVVGNPTWSQDVDVAAADPISGYGNIAYTLHFYAGTHGQALREKAQKALDAGVALFVTEWGTVNANGDGGVADEATREWMAFIRDNQLSHANWSLADKDEGASLLKPGAASDGGWQDEDLTASGKYVRDIVRTWND